MAERESDSGPDQVEEYACNPPPEFLCFIPRILPPDRVCLERRLSEDEIAGEKPCIWLTVNEVRPLTWSAFDLLGPPGMARAYLQSYYAKRLLVFDTSSSRRQYKILLTNHEIGGTLKYKLSEEWNRFARDHNLEAGDLIAFYQFCDVISNYGYCFYDYYYAIDYVRKPARSLRAKRSPFGAAANRVIIANESQRTDPICKYCTGAVEQVDVLSALFCY